MAARRRDEMAARFHKLVQAPVAELFPYKESVQGDELDRLLADLPKPPNGKALVELQAGDWLRTPPRWLGAFCAGRFTWKGQPLVAIGYPRHVPSKLGDYAELFAELPVPEGKGPLTLDFFVNDTRLENRYPGFRYLQLWAGDRLL